MGKRVELVWPEDLVAAIDRAADGRPRSVWLRQVVEKSLAGDGPGDTHAVSSPRESRSVEEVRAAEQPATSRPSVPVSAAMERQARLNKAKGL